jgi:CheY-like chemotaxis protein
MQREKRTILVVDSSASFIFYVAMMLRKLQYVVQTASTAEDALKMIAGTAPAVIIVDTVLPKTSGVDLLKQIKQNSSLSFIPVMIHTADRDPAVKDACARAGCACYFLKPVEPDALYRAIQAATEATPRKNIRISVALKARVVSKAGDRMEEVTSLSEGGLYVKTSAPEPVQAVVSLKLLIRTREIKVTARVLYSSAKAGGPHAVPGMGVSFETIDPEDRTFIREFIREQVTNALATKPRQ